MKSTDQQFDPAQWSENADSIVERMRRAKWITGKSGVGPGGLIINWSELGWKRMNRASDALMNMVPDYSEAKGKTVLKKALVKLRSVLKMFPAAFQLAMVKAELKPPAFSRREWEMMVQLLRWFAREKGRQQIPPSRGYRPPQP